MEDIKVLIDGSLSVLDRQDVLALVNFLDASDFYTAPCSTKFHLACPGGLAQHTYNVMKCASRINQQYENLFNEESIILTAVGHDLCKVNFYQELDELPTDPQMKYLTSLLQKAGIQTPTKLNKAYAGVLIEFMLKEYKTSPDCVILPPYQHNYIVKDEMPLGHGEKSLYIMQQFINLTIDEALSIRWHMAFFDAGIHFPYPSGYAYQEAIKKSKLVSIIILADIEASNLMEV